MNAPYPPHKLQSQLWMLLEAAWLQNETSGRKRVEHAKAFFKSAREKDDRTFTLRKKPDEHLQFCSSSESGIGVPKKVATRLNIFCTKRTSHTAVHASQWRLFGEVFWLLFQCSVQASRNCKICQCPFLVSGNLVSCNFQNHTIA